jgi:hypothetical protein
VNNDAPTTFNGGNPLEIEVGPNGNQTYSVVGTVTCSQQSQLPDSAGSFHLH